MLSKAKVAVCSDIRTKHSKQSELNVEFLNANLVVGKETSRLKLNLNSDKFWMLFLRGISIHVGVDMKSMGVS